MPIAWTITLAFVVSISQPLIIPYVAFAQKTVDVTKTIKFADSLLKSRQIDSAIAVYTALSTQVSKHSAEEARTLIGLGQGYLLKNQLYTALVHLHHAFACLKGLPNEITLYADAYSAAGVVHARMKHFDHAVSYLDMALQLLEAPNADRL